MKLIAPADAKKITSLWDRHVRQKMGRVRMRVNTIFGAAALGWYGTFRMIDYVRNEVDDKLFRTTRKTK